MMPEDIDSIVNRKSSIVNQIDFPHRGRLFLTLWIVFCFFADPLLEINTVRYLYLSRAIVEDHSFVVDRFAHPSRGDLALHAGHLYSGCLPGIGLMLTPHAWAAKVLAQALSLRATQALQILSIFFFSAPASAFAAILLMQILSDLGLSRRRSLFFGLVAVLGTPLFFFTAKLSDYPLVTLMELIIVRVILTPIASEKSMGRHIAGPDWKRWALAGGAIGILATINNLAVALAVILVLAATPVFPLKRFCLRGLMILLGAIAPILARSFYLMRCFGSAAADPLSFSAAGITINEVYARYPGIGRLLGAALRQAPSILYGLTIGKVGFFVFAPIFILLFFAYLEKKSFGRRLALAVFFTAAVNFLAHFLLIGDIWTGGASWGPRYMLFSSTLLLIAIAVSSTKISGRAIVPLGAISIGINTIGVQYGYNESVIDEIGLFLIGGPTTPFFRWLWLFWPIPPTPERVALVMEETPRIGHYYAFTHPTFLFPALLMVGILLILWLPVIKRRFENLRKVFHSSSPRSEDFG